MNRSLEVLLVEDNEGDIELVERALEGGDLSCRLAVVHNGLEALDYLSKQGKYANATTPELILLDINMPGMDGKKLLEIVKQIDNLKLIPTIMLTSSDAPGDILECYERHANGYVIKPFDARAFIETVQKTVGLWGTLMRLPSRVGAA